LKKQNNLMKIKLSATYEGNCTICGKEKIVFTAGDEDTHKTVSVCQECSDKFGKKQTSEIIEEFGKDDKESFKDGMKIEKKPRAG